MKMLALCTLVLTALTSHSLHAQQNPDKKTQPAVTTTSTAKVQFITVDKDVKLEVLDWGGTGRPLVFLAGLGGTAHIFDNFAPKFTPKYHVYGITRRGFGASSAPAPNNENYSANRLGDDVLAVMEALKLDRPVLVGHSFGGEEMSSIGSRYPEKVSGLIYLDAGYAYAFYNQKLGNTEIDGIYLKRELDEWIEGQVQEDPKEFVKNLQASLSQYQKDLDRTEKWLDSMPAEPKQSNKKSDPEPPIPIAMLAGQQKYTEIHVPVLAFFADPHDFGTAFKDNPAAQAAMMAEDRTSTTAQAKAFQAGIPSAQVILLPNARHDLFRSNEAEVIRDMNAFLAKLP